MGSRGLLLAVAALVALLVAVPVWQGLRTPDGAAEEQAQAPPVVTRDEGVEPPAPAREPEARVAARVARVVDGDTIVLESGTTVRLLQLDAPEVRGSECYADEATAALERLLPAGTPVTVEEDPALDRVDRYGRQLAYVHAGGENVNLALVRDGAASVWYYRGARGRYADALLAAAEDARAAGRGLWGACEATFDPLGPVSTAPRGGAVAPALPPPSASAAVPVAEGCHPSYDPCLPLVGDLDCPDVRALGLAPVTVRGPDSYRLDGDRDGVGCE